MFYTPYKHKKTVFVLRGNKNGTLPQCGLFTLQSEKIQPYPVDTKLRIKIDMKNGAENKLKTGYIMVLKQ